jgi:hypothetical protein
MGEFSRDDRLEIVYEDGHPSYFKEKPQNTLAITESTASYLQVARPVSASGYLSGTSTPGSISRAGSPAPSSALSSRGTSPIRLSPSMFTRSTRSLSSAARGRSHSILSDIETEEPPVFNLSNPEIVIEDDTSGIQPLKVEDAATPEPYGRRLIPQIMDELAAVQPERIVFSLATLSGNTLEQKHISARTFTKAVDKTAWWLHSQVGKPDSIQPVGYIGPRMFTLDSRHSIFVDLNSLTLKLSQTISDTSS